MNLIYIYGPPGVGKLATARELSTLTGYRLFHNQISIDCVLPVFDVNTETFWNLVNQIRFMVIEAAARQNVDLIVTEAYSSPKDDDGVLHTCSLVEKHGGRVCPVQLTCDTTILEERFQAPRSDRGWQNLLCR